MKLSAGDASRHSADRREMFSDNVRALVDSNRYTLQHSLASFPLLQHLELSPTSLGLLLLTVIRSELLNLDCKHFCSEKHST